MERTVLDPRLRLVQDAPLKEKVVLVRVDHNVVKKGVIQDPYRIDVTLGTLYYIAAKGGRPILLTHNGRPRDKKTGEIICREEESVFPIIQYLGQILPIKIHAQEFPIDAKKGILHLNKSSLSASISDLKDGKIGMIYLPNSRWFYGEESTEREQSEFAKELAQIADVYVNDAFGSWRPHASTYDVAKHLPSFAGVMLQREIQNLDRVLSPKNPFLAIIAGAKYDTKIGPLKSLYRKVDYLILGGLIYNHFISAKYGIHIEGISEEDKAQAEQLVALDRAEKKILEMPYLVASETLGGKYEGKFKTIRSKDFKKGAQYSYIVDADPKSFQEPRIKEAIRSAKTIFVNAVMGLMPHFYAGSQALYRLIMSNQSARKLFGGGDTLQELRNLCPGSYLLGLNDPDTYYFTGGGSVLSAIEQGSPYLLKPVEVLMEK